ncbi:hypothetical protein [Streptomyces sp. ICC4]|nr:hypothetical protein [Streptomyces sp. ICC4]
MRLRVKNAGPVDLQSGAEASQIASKGTSGQLSEVSFVNEVQFAAKQRSS